MEYTALIKTASTRGSIVPIDNIRSNQIDRNNNLCRVCKNKQFINQQTDHTPVDCLSQRCELLENEVVRLKDHDIKSNLKTKELENKIFLLEDAIKALTIPLPIQQQATPFSFSARHRDRNPLKKSISEDRSTEKASINYNNIITPPGSNSRDRVGLFGSLGASSQR